MKELGRIIRAREETDHASWVSLSMSSRRRQKSKMAADSVAEPMTMTSASSKRSRATLSRPRGAGRSARSDQRIDPVVPSRRDAPRLSGASGADVVRGPTMGLARPRRVKRKSPLPELAARTMPCRREERRADLETEERRRVESVAVRLSRLPAVVMLERSSFALPSRAHAPDDGCAPSEGRARFSWAEARRKTSP